LAHHDRNTAAPLGAERPETVAHRLELVGIYAHEINNHLTVILGCCDLAGTPGVTDATISNHLAEIRSSALLIARLAKGLAPLEH